MDWRVECKVSVYIALLRGINVGGKNIVKMQELRNTLAKLGFTNITTYIQSGNIVFESTKNTEQIQLEMEMIIEKDFGLIVPVIIRTVQEFQQIINELPKFPNDEFVHIAFLSKETSYSPEELSVIGKGTDEQFYISGREIYLYLPSGMQKAKIPNSIQKKSVTVTIRNIRTIHKLLEVALKVVHND